MNDQTNVVSPVYQTESKSKVTITPGQFLTKTWLLVFFCLAFFFLAFSTKNSGVVAALTTTGAGSQKILADRVKITYAISLSGSDANLLYEKGETTTSQVMKMIQAMNPESIKKVDSRVVQNTGGNFQYISGAQVELKDFTKINEVQRLLVQNGASVAQIAYSLSDSQLIEQDVRQLAFDKAKEKAQVLAKSSGTRLGRVIGVVEQASNSETGTAVTQGQTVMNGSSPTQEIELTASVQVSFAIKSWWWPF